MDYKKYYKNLITKNEERKNEFPRLKVFKHSNNNYYTDAFVYKKFKYNFVISSENSRIYGKDFVGLIVELYIDHANYSESYFNQIKNKKMEIEKEMQIEDLIWQSPEETESRTVARVYARKAVDIDDESRWNEYIDWQLNTMIHFLNVLPKYTKDLIIMNDTNIPLESQMEPPMSNSIKTKNIILYGPPGVGKTHNLKRLVSLIESGESDQKVLFDTITKNSQFGGTDEMFNQVESEGRAVFVTFHQSYAYEDFIEGFRPNEEGKISLEDGVFKALCTKARENIFASSDSEKSSFKVALDRLLAEKNR